MGLQHFPSTNSALAFVRTIFVSHYQSGSTIKIGFKHEDVTCSPSSSVFCMTRRDKTSNVRENVSIIWKFACDIITITLWGKLIVRCSFSRQWRAIICAEMFLRKYCAWIVKYVPNFQCDCDICVLMYLLQCCMLHLKVNMPKRNIT